MKKKQKGLSLSKKKDFLLLKKEGRKISKEGFFIIYRKNRQACCRFALFFPKWTGKAVQRNRFKRWARHFLREKQSLEAWDLMLGFEKQEKDFYKGMNYKCFCAGFEKVYREIKR